MIEKLNNVLCEKGCKEIIYSKNQDIEPGYIKYWLVYRTKIKPFSIEKLNTSLTFNVVFFNFP